MGEVIEVMPMTRKAVPPSLRTMKYRAAQHDAGGTLGGYDFQTGHASSRRWLPHL